MTVLAYGPHPIPGIPTVHYAVAAGHLAVTGSPIGSELGLAVAVFLFGLVLTAWPVQKESKRAIFEIARFLRETGEDISVDNVVDYLELERPLRARELRWLREEQRRYDRDTRRVFESFHRSQT